MTAAKQRLFVLAGMPRTATTFLYQRFQEHPDSAVAEKTGC